MPRPKVIIQLYPMLPAEGEEGHGVRRNMPEVRMQKRRPEDAVESISFTRTQSIALQAITEGDTVQHFDPPHHGEPDHHQPDRRHQETPQGCRRIDRVRHDSRLGRAVGPVRSEASGEPGASVGGR